MMDALPLSFAELDRVSRQVALVAPWTAGSGFDVVCSDTRLLDVPRVWLSVKDCRALARGSGPAYVRARARLRVSLGLWLAGRGGVL